VALGKHIHRLYDILSTRYGNSIQNNKIMLWIPVDNKNGCVNLSSFDLPLLPHHFHSTKIKYRYCIECMEEGK
jgi:hypothetical protein